MTVQQSYLTPHSIFGEKTFEQHCAQMPELYLKQEVPEDVHKNFDIVRKLLAHSYFQYNFIDEAYNKALLTLEMAMSIRYKELMGKTKGMEFSKLYNGLISLDQFDSEKSNLKYFQTMRNHRAHPKNYSVAGIFIWNQFENITGLINEMYEDSTLRKERKKLLKEINKQIIMLAPNGMAICETDEESTVGYAIQVLFVNNKEEPNHYHLVFTPLFEPSPMMENPLEGPACSWNTIHTPRFTDGVIKGSEVNTNETIIIRSVNHDANMETRSAAWIENYKSLKNRFQYDRSIFRNYNLCYAQLFKGFLRK